MTNNNRNSEFLISQNNFSPSQSSDFNSVTYYRINFIKMYYKNETSITHKNNCRDIRKHVGIKNSIKTLKKLLLRMPRVCVVIMKANKDGLL